MNQVVRKNKVLAKKIIEKYGKNEYN